MIDVVNDEAGRDFYYVAVHITGDGAFDIFAGCVALGVKGIAIFSNVPFVSAERSVILGVNDGKFAFSQGNATEGIAIASATIGEHEPN